MTSGFKRPNISRNTCWNCNFSLPFKNLPRKLHVIQTPLQKLGRNSLNYVMNISYFSHFTWNISGHQCMDLEAALAWKPALLVWQRKYHVNSFIYKKAIELYCNLWKLFYSKWTEIIVEIQLIWFWLTNILCLLSDYRKEEIIWSMNLINGFGARGCSIRDIYLPVVLLT